MIRRNPPVASFPVRCPACGVDVDVDVRVSSITTTGLVLESVELNGDTRGHVETCRGTRP